MITPTDSYRITQAKKPEKVLSGLDATVNGFIGRWKRFRLGVDELRREAEQVDARSKVWQEVTDPKLRERLREFRSHFRRGGEIEKEVLFDALAAIREASERLTGMRPYVVQLMGALALHRGCLVEMATGEGKTLTAALAATLAGWTRRPCHIVTVNDYLVQRDAEWFGPLYRYCGVKVGFVTDKMAAPERQKGYAADVTYATSKELLADFLRDRISLGELNQPTRRLLWEMSRGRLGRPPFLVQRGLHTAIVDEADSILIDEAVTPLIISANSKNREMQQAVTLAKSLAAGLVAGVHYHTNFKYKEIEFTDEGNQFLEEKCRDLPGFWGSSGRRKELISQALQARDLFRLGKEYLISDGKVMIVDEFTGRVMANRTWREGMHQAIEAKEGLEISPLSETIARMSFQRFFRCFYRLAGMTGTAQEATGEFWQIYRLPVVSIPPNRPCVRQHWPDRVFADEASKIAAVVETIEKMHAQRRPLLVGTRSVAASELISKLLQEKGLAHRVLNAARHKEEANIIVEAGEVGQITIATNMAGRGTDIKLGEGVTKLGGLHVIATERHESGRVDRQLFGRAGRQGDPGSAQAFVSIEDELVRRFVPGWVRGRVKTWVEKQNKGWKKAASLAVSKAQNDAQKLAFRQRKTVLQTDNWLDDALSFTGGE